MWFLFFYFSSPPTISSGRCLPKMFSLFDLLLTQGFHFAFSWSVLLIRALKHTVNWMMNRLFSQHGSFLGKLINWFNFERAQTFFLLEEDFLQKSQPFVFLRLLQTASENNNRRDFNFFTAKSQAINKIARFLFCFSPWWWDRRKSIFRVLTQLKTWSIS